MSDLAREASAACRRQANGPHQQQSSWQSRQSKSAASTSVRPPAAAETIQICPAQLVAWKDRAPYSAMQRACSTKRAQQAPA